MQCSASVAPRHHIFCNNNLPRKKPTKINCQKTQTKYPHNKTHNNNNNAAYANHHLHTPICIRKEEKEGFSHWGIPSNMWWADLRAAIGQRVNLEGICSSVSVVVKDRQLAMPHVKVRDIRCIDWAELERAGFRGVVFDKDNTVTVPYSLGLWEPLGGSLERCRAVFGDNIAVFSNSAGLQEYDPHGRKAKALEFMIGIKVIRHKVKKPAGSADEIERHLGCESSRLVMVGDRPFTDIVYGNRNGFLTILTEPLSLAEEPFIVKQVRKLELAILSLWSKRGVKPLTHKLLRDGIHFVTDPPPL